MNIECRDFTVIFFYFFQLTTMISWIFYRDFLAVLIMPLEARDSAFYLDDKKMQLLSGAVHYFRVVPDYWEDRLMRLKACGLNCVET